MGTFFFSVLPIVLHYFFSLFSIPVQQRPPMLKAICDAIHFWKGDLWRVCFFASAPTPMSIVGQLTITGTTAETWTETTSTDEPFLRWCMDSVDFILLMLVWWRKYVCVCICVCVRSRVCDLIPSDYRKDHPEIVHVLLYSNALAACGSMSSIETRGKNHKLSTRQSIWYRSWNDFWKLTLSKHTGVCLSDQCQF